VVASWLHIGDFASLVVVDSEDIGADGCSFRDGVNVDGGFEVVGGWYVPDGV